LRKLYDPLEKFNLASRMEKGVHKFSFFIYPILSEIAGIIMEILALLRKVGFICYVIPSILLTGGSRQIFFALYIMKMGRQFMVPISNII